MMNEKKDMNDKSNTNAMNSEKCSEVCHSQKFCSDYTSTDYKCVDIPKEADVRFYRCSVCGQIVAVIGTEGNPLTCCMRDMQLLEPGVIDASVEKHVPVFERHGHKVIVHVGSEDHPMTPEHHIEWICLVTCQGVQWKSLEGKTEPCTKFRIAGGENVAAVYAYCNLHGLWKCC